MNYVCPECGYNAGENGEKILQIHMSAQHGPNSPKFMTSDQLAKIKDENDVVIARSYLVFGGIAVLLGLGITFYGYNTYAMLTCSSISGCFISQSLIDQINTSGFALVYEGSQETVYGGLLLLPFGTIGVTYWRARKLALSREFRSSSSLESSRSYL